MHDGPAQCRKTTASWLAPVLIVAAATACGSAGAERGALLVSRDTLRPPLPPLSPPPQEQRVGGLTYQASVYTIEMTPPLITITVGARDSLRRPIHEPISGCPVGLEVFRGPERTGRPLWRSAPLPGSECPIGPPVAYPSGMVERRYSVAEILGDSIPPGRYHWTAVLAIDGDTLRFPTGSKYLYPDTLPVTSDWSTLQFRAETHLEGAAPVAVVPEVHVTNPGERRVQIGLGGCALRLRAYRTPGREGRPVWRSELRTDPRNPRVSYACFSSLGILTIHPGESRTLSASLGHIPVYEILADSLPEGRYYFTAELEVIDPLRQGADRADTLRLPAGNAVLRRNEGPLPAEKVVRGLRYRADLGFVSLNPDTLRASVTIQNVSGERMELSVERGCPLHLYVYRSRKERDRVPMVEGAPAFPRSCGGGLHPFELGPGEAWTFYVDVPAAEVAEVAGSGQRYFTVIPRLNRGPLAVLSAGEAWVRE